MAKYTRKNVYANGGDFSDPTILWYARGVKAMNARKLADPLAWRFFAGIHGFDRPIWKALGYLKTSDKLPSSALQKQFWKQCQHGSWYFLPWHRGYLLAPRGLHPRGDREAQGAERLGAPVLELLRAG